jgi:hypothetical protein
MHDFLQGLVQLWLNALEGRIWLNQWLGYDDNAKVISITEHITLVKSSNSKKRLSALTTLESQSFVEN